MRHRGLAVALIGLAALAAVGGASGGIGQTLVVQRASILLASVPGLAVGKMSAADGGLTIDDIDYRAEGGVRLHVGRLVLPGGTTAFPGLVGSAEAEPAGIVAIDVTITVSHAIISVPRIEAQGTYLTADRLKALLDPSTALPAADRLKELTAASLAAPSVTITAKPPALDSAVPPNPDDDGKATLEDVALTDVVAGRIGSASVRKTTVFKTSAAGAPTVATLGPVTLNGLDLPLAVRIVETGRADSAEPIGTIYGSLLIRDILIAPDDTASISIGTIAADGFKGRPLLRRPADVVALIQSMNDSRTADDSKALADIAVDAAKSFSLAHLEWDDIAISGKSEGPFTFKVSRMAIDGMSPAQIGTWVLADLSATSDEASFSLQRLVIRGPDESQLVDLLARELATSGLAMDRIKLMGGVPQDGSLSMLGLHVDVPSPEQPGNSPNGRRNIVDVPIVSFAAETDPLTKVATTTAHMQATYALQPVSDNPGFAALARNGFTGLDARADYRLAFDPKGQEIRLDPLTVAAEKLGRISVSADVGNIPFDLLARGRPASDAETALQQVTFKGFTLDFRNDGAVQMMLPVLAASANTSVPMLKVGAKTQSDLFIGQTLGATPAAARLEAAIDAFIDDPQTLHITVTAPAGLTGAEIQASPDPKSLLDRVGIEATANR